MREGTYTIESPKTGDHRTFRVRGAEWANGKPEGTQVIEMLTGPDNSLDFTGFGFILPDGTVQIWSRYKDNAVMTWSAGYLVAKDEQGLIGMGECYAMRSGRCARCGRKLTVPASLHRGLGPECAKKVGF